MASSDIMHNIDLLMNPKKRAPSDAMSTISSASRDSIISREIAAAGASRREAPLDATVRVVDSAELHSPASEGLTYNGMNTTNGATGAWSLPSSAARRASHQPARAASRSVSETEEDDETDESSSAEDSSCSHVAMSPEQVLRAKREMMYQLDRLEKKGVRMPRKYTMADPLEDMRAELERIRLDREVDASIKFQRKAIMACVTGIEFLNTKFDPFDLRLEGWSDSMYENLDDYDDVFEELYIKYRSKSKMAPELKLMFMMGGSGMMFHLTQSMFRTASLPGLEQVMRQNPDLRRQVTQATVNMMQQQQQPAPPQAQAQAKASGGGGLFGLFGSMLGGGGGGRWGGGGVGPGFTSQPPPHMRGPVHVDEILRELHHDAFPGGAPLHAGPPPPQATAVPGRRNIEVVTDTDSDIGDTIMAAVDTAPAAATAPARRGRGGGARASSRGGRTSRSVPTLDV
jgi:hypothetical protein